MSLAKLTIMKALSLITLISTLFLLTFTPASGAEWVLYGRTPSGSYYYDKQSIVSDGKGIIKVWGKKVYSEEGKDDYIQSMKKKGFYNENNEDISYDLDLYGINCSTREFDVISFERRDEAGNIITSVPPTHLSWNPIPQESIIELLYKAVCKGNGKKIAL